MKTLSKTFILYLIITAVICGALVMVVEVMGSRVIGPFFGVSLFVWTSLIAVTLVALAAGYAVGGILSDRKGTADYLYGIILLSGLFVLLVPVTKEPILLATQPLGLRMGSLVSSVFLFGPSLFLLGCVSPYIVKLAAREMENIGRTVGVFYALSTIGSFLGTLSTGFVLIAYFGVNRIFVFIGILLMALSTGYFLFFRKKWLPLFFLIIPLFFSTAHSPVSKVLPNGTRVTEVFRKEGFYGTLKVFDFSYGPRHTREMLIDSVIQGGIDMKNGMPIYEYAYFLSFLPYALNPDGRRCLVIGLGPGVVPMWYEGMGITTDVVDIDPAVVAVAREYFGFHNSGEVVITDARYFLNTSEKRYDYIVLDVFNGDITPSHILSLETLRLVRTRMTAGGILAMNIAGSLEGDTFITASLVKTLREVFATVELYPIFSPEEGRGWGNLAVIAYDYPAVPFDPGMTKDFAVHPLARKEVRRFMKRQFIFPAETPAIVLSDDYNPIDFYDRKLKERLRREILSSYDLDLLL